MRARGSQRPRLVTGLALAALAIGGCVPGATTPAPEELRPVAVEDVRVEVGSPIPVDILVSGTWPDLCAQLAEVRQTVRSNAIEISRLTSALDPTCPPDHLGVPFRMAIPINIVELPEGAYRLQVNGLETSFDWPQAP